MTCLALAACWPHAGYDAARTQWNPAEHRLTAARVGDLEVRWRTALPGLARAAPVSVRGALYVAGASGHVTRVDGDTGEVVWDRVVDPGLSPVPPILSNPVWVSGRLRVTWSCCRFGVSGTVWLDPATGGDAEEPPAAAGAGPGAPALASGRLAGSRASPPSIYTVTWGETSATAFGGEGGTGPGSQFAIVGRRVQWTYGRWAQAFSGPCRPQDDTYHPCAPDWRVDLGADPGPPVGIAPGAVAYADSAGRLTVLDAGTGAIRWRADLGGAPAGPPAVSSGAAGTVLVPLATGEVVALPADGCGAPTCTPLWRAAVAGVEAVTGGGDVAYATTAGGEVVALPANGCGAPACEPLARVVVGGTLSPPVVDAGRVVVVDGAGDLVALGLPT